MLLSKHVSWGAVAKRIFNIKKTIPRIRLFIDYFPEYGLNLEKWYLLLRVRNYTQLNSQGLSKLYDLAGEIEKKKIRGAFVECGIWKGGACAVMAYIAQKAKSHRKTWLFDSFNGMPEPQEIDGEMARQWASGVTTGRLMATGLNVAGIEEVNRLFFENFNFNREDIVIKKGWVQYTLPVSKLELGEISILRIDVDWYAATKACLDYLYDNVVPGGYIIIDDSNFFVGCNIAVDTFIKERNLKIELLEIKKSGVYFKKP